LFHFLLRKIKTVYLEIIPHLDIIYVYIFSFHPIQLQDRHRLSWMSFLHWKKELLTV
jgi:hypothetical protein